MKEIVVPLSSREEAQQASDILNGTSHEDIWARVVCRGSVWCMVLHEDDPGSNRDHRHDGEKK